MFRKIRSKRPPEKTVWADLSDELAPHIQKIYHHLKLVLFRFPKTIFACMLIALIYSVLWSFSSDRRGGDVNTQGFNKKDERVQNPQGTNHRLNAISRTAGDLRRTITIRNKVDSVLNKTKLSQADSVFLEDALRELKTIQQP